MLLHMTAVALQEEGSLSGLGAGGVEEGGDPSTLFRLVDPPQSLADLLQMSPGDALSSARHLVRQQVQWLSIIIDSRVWH